MGPREKKGFQAICPKPFFYLHRICTQSFLRTNLVIDGQSTGNPIVETDRLVVRLKHFPDSELKSSKIGKREDLRSRILNRLGVLNFKIYCLIVDKRKIHLNSGLQYKESFYKFLYGILYNRLFTTFHDISIFADEMIYADFVEALSDT